jgi:cytochrome c-type biogenesis protein
VNSAASLPNLATGSLSSVATSGSLILALLVSALAGLVSFASPCVLPRVPGYLGYVTGLAGVELERQRRGRMLAGAGMFVLGFTVVFVAISAAFGGVGSLLVEHRLWLTRGLGVVTIALGVVFTGLIQAGQRNWRVRWRPAAGLAGAPLLGAVFGLGWAPCIGPTLGAVLALATSDNQASVTRGATLATAYCLGLGLPFLISAVAFGRISRLWSVLSRHQRAIQITGGLLLVAVGVALVTGAWTNLVSDIQRQMPFTPAV